MNADDFERKLQRQPMRAVPTEWRADILRQARLAAVEELATLSWWRELLWPHPAAWATLAAAWVVALALHAATPALVSNATPTPSRDAMQMAAEQRRELARLLSDPTELSAVTKPKTPGPRSERQTDRSTGRGDIPVAPMVLQNAATGMSPLPVRSVC